MTALLAAALFGAFFEFPACFARASERQDNLLGVDEGWAWPVVVIMPPEGWESAQGDAVKRAMRTAEREISLERDAIMGKEVTFMFSDISEASELPARIAMWRAMRAAAIVSFAGDDFNSALSELCREKGPSLLIPGGEAADIISDETGRPYPFLFALDLPYYARANAIAEAVSKTGPGAEAAVLTDMLSARLARGAELTSRFLEARGVGTLDMSITAYRQDQFAPQIRELKSEGVGTYVCWLDAMAALSIWQSLERREIGLSPSSTVYYFGPARKILSDAEGMMLVDKDILLESDENGKRDVITKILDAFAVTVKDPVTAGKAYALAKWVTGAYRTVGSDDTQRIAYALEKADGIPLMSETLTIDPNTHRPKSRGFGILVVSGKKFELYGSVEIFSSETEER
ncbi:MAG: ABC transporter substrate-binding protein [Synergistaceae bacterium]|nr:ABC transporter substrate-binding protein [Synergistaceae bacterium]